jgi:hypothetical protein
LRNDLPNSKTPNLSITFGISDLAADISSACDFIKIDSKLNEITIDKRQNAVQPVPETYSTKPPQPTPSYKESFADELEIDPGQSTSTTPPNVTQSTVTPMTTQAQTTVSMSMPTPTQVTVNLDLNEGGYSVPYTQLQIYKMYNSATGYSNTSNEKLYAIMDNSYGMLFDSAELSNLTDKNIEKLWNEHTSNSIDNVLYNDTNYFAIQSKSANRTRDVFTSYFLQKVKKNKSNAGVLLSLKHAYYAIIKPRFLLNTLSTVYWQNVKYLTNSDKGTHDSVIFVLNTCSSLARNSTLSADLSEADVAKILSNDTPFTMDSLLLYQLVSISFELYQFVIQFEKNAYVSSNPITTASKFISGYPLYLKKVNQIEQTSPLVFLLQYPPSS